MGDKTTNVNPRWLENNFPCMTGCPVNTESGKYVDLIAQGRFEEAYRIARKPNPFASICGRICAAPCEDVCRRGKIDQPLAIRALKRFVTERFGIESMIDVLKIHDVLKPRIQKKDKWVAIVGSGPAGMSCAHDLALMGYNVTVFEAQDVPGGMLRLGIPEYRLPRELIRLEINTILSLGVKLKTGKRLGQDFKIRDLQENGYEAVFLAIGAHKSRNLDIEGIHSDGVLNAVDYLLNINLGYRVELGEKIVVIGGGNVAFDVARTAARQDKNEPLVYSDITAALDVARSAVRFGAKKVDMIVLEEHNKMLADNEEVEQAQEEHINIHNAFGPKRILADNGRVSAIEINKVKSLFDTNGRFSPQYISGSEKLIEADSIIVAIGQTADLNFIDPADGIEITDQGTVKIDPQTLATTATGIFAGGDLAFGPRIAIEAVADGKKAAKSINAFLDGEKTEKTIYQITCFNSHSYRKSADYMKTERQPVPVLPIDRRVGISQVELGYSEIQARKEASRCLRCWENTVFEGDDKLGTECILCGGCADVCPENCIEIVPLSNITNKHKAYSLTAEKNPHPEQNTERKGLVLIKDEDRCIRCGLCALRCPVGTISMQGFDTKIVTEDESEAVA